MSLPSDPTSQPANSPLDSVAASAAAAIKADVKTREHIVHRRTILSGRYVLFIALVLLLAFGVLTFLALGLEPLAFDVPVTLALQRMQWPFIEPLMVGVSALGFMPLLAIIPTSAILILLLLRLPWEAAWLALATSSAAAAEIVKLLVQRPRPSPDLVSVFSPLHSYSFPSGHVTHFVTFYGFVFYLAFIGLKHGWLRTIILTVCGLLILLVGPSRIWLGQHWASDVLGGYSLGFLLLIILIELHRAWATTRIKAAQQTPNRAVNVQT